MTDEKKLEGETPEDPKAKAAADIAAAEAESFYAQMRELSKSPVGVDEFLAMIETDVLGARRFWAVIKDIPEPDDAQIGMLVARIKIATQRVAESNRARTTPEHVAWRRVPSKRGI